MSCDIRQKLSQLRTESLEGDQDSVRRCEAEFGTPLRRIVRRVVRTGRTRDGLSTTILQEARKVRKMLPGLTRNDLVSEVTTRLCALLVGQNLDHRLDTVLAGGEATAVA